MKNDIVKEMEQIVKTNPRSQSGKKEILLGVYINIVKVFIPLFKPDDEQRDAADMSELKESDESAAQKEQSAKGLKILTPNQMLSRLPITLAQLKAESNSEKLKNEIRQLLHSLYRSKKLTKTIYNHLITLFKNGNSLYVH